MSELLMVISVTLGGRSKAAPMDMGTTTVFAKIKNNH
jgi:hypothetical protein